MSETCGPPLWTGDALANATGGTLFHTLDGELSPIRVSYNVTGRNDGEDLCPGTSVDLGKNRRETVGETITR